MEMERELEVGMVRAAVDNAEHVESLAKVADILDEAIDKAREAYPAVHVTVNLSMMQTPTDLSCMTFSTLPREYVTPVIESMAMYFKTLDNE